MCVCVFNVAAGVYVCMGVCWQLTAGELGVDMLDTPQPHTLNPKLNCVCNMAADSRQIGGGHAKHNGVYVRLPAASALQVC